ncbi:hypothetical protein ACH5RR_003313 [Cinchona calisaya]|uniref:Sesquiterpene synthase n=1 Tax=Cinchona calisaya TaxID=153742 RepID=A0ABD3AV56_9GENT
MEFYSSTQVLAGKAACLLYLCLVDDKIDEKFAYRIKSDLPDFVAKIKHLHYEIIHAYMDYWDTESISVLDEYVVDFADSLIESLLRDLSMKHGVSIKKCRYTFCVMQASVEQLPMSHASFS